MRLAELPARAVAGLFRLWQLTVSVVLPPSCRFSPSCSHYGIEALRRHGLLAGLWLTAARIARCHPWGGSGLDPCQRAGNQIYRGSKGKANHG